jgi:hypothetical protein
MLSPYNNLLEGLALEAASVRISKISICDRWSAATHPQYTKKPMQYESSPATIAQQT